MDKDAIAKTPLEAALENELTKIGLPFKERCLYHETLFERHLEIQQYGSRDFKIMSPLVRSNIRRQQRTIDYFQELVHRATGWSAKKLYVSYTVFPSDENIAEFQRNLGDMSEIVNRVIKERRFEIEQVRLHDAANCPLTQELIDRLKVEAGSPLLTKGYLKKMARRLRKEDREYDAYNTPEEARFLWIESEGNKMSTDQGPDVRSDFFEGITSPVEHAKTLAQRIAGFITEIENTK